MSSPINVIKRGGRRPAEDFNADKLYASLRAACLSAGEPDGQATVTAQTVCFAVTDWVNSKPAITSNDIRRKAAERLTHLHADAAYWYRHHHLVL